MLLAPARASRAGLVLLGLICLGHARLGLAAPRHITPAQLGVIVNSADPLSVSIGSYYAAARHIPARNLIRVRFDGTRDDLPLAQFNRIRAAAQARAGARLQAYALTWARPYRVECMSITTAFAFGFDRRFCASGCQPTLQSPYFNSASAAPYTDLHLRPAMSIAALDLDSARSLIDRGVAADGSQPHGTAYLAVGDDPARSVRSVEYYRIGSDVRRGVDIQIVRGTTVHDRNDVMFYFIGALAVPDLTSNRFLPGAMADHLTSFGGMLTDSTGQMSSLRWLEAGATGSYGTVVEPCNLLGKFPNVGLAMSHYLAGETLIEAYWKSVAMPGQGLFIGEPLAAPFRRSE